MNLDAYMSAADYALTHLLAGLWHEREELDSLRNQVEALKASTGADTPVDDLLDLSTSINASPTDDELERLYVEIYELESTEAELSRLSGEVLVRVPSLNALASGVLQVAKNGFSAVKGPPSQWSSGALLCGNVDEKNLVWQGRNQAMHAGEGQPHPPVCAVFDDLKANASNPRRFDGYENHSKATAVVDLLGWRSASDVRGTLKRVIQ